MPSEDFSEEGLPNIPNLELAQWHFLLTTKKHTSDKVVVDQLMSEIKTKDMAHYYVYICNCLHWTQDKNLLESMREKNKTKLKELDEAIVDAEENLGEIEIRDAMMKRAEYLMNIGDREGCVSQLRTLAEQKTLTIGYRLDLCFFQIRIGLFYGDHDLICRMLEKSNGFIEQGGDWDRKNRLQVYQGVYDMSIRDFKSAAKNFLSGVATFTSYELMTYSQFITYTILCSIISLPRTELREKVVRGPEILEQLHSLPTLKQFLLSLYNCKYDELFQELADLEGRLKYDRLFAPHYAYYVREMRILAYSQLLESYKSLTLDFMARAFGVTVDFIDAELARFIAAGRLHCKIDKVNGIVETNRPDSKNQQYQNAIKHGDVLLNRVQKISRVINI